MDINRGGYEEKTKLGKMAPETATISNPKTPNNTKTSNNTRRQLKAPENNSQWRWAENTSTRRRPKYGETRKIWGNLAKKWKKQQPDPAVEDEWRRYQIRGGGGRNGKNGREQERNNYSVRQWRMTGEESKLSGEKTRNGWENRMGNNNYTSWLWRMMSGDESTGTQPAMEEKTTDYGVEDSRL